MIDHDWLPGFAIHTQMKRKITSDLPKYVAMNAFAMSLLPDGACSYCTQYSYEYRGYQSDLFSP